MKNDKLIPTIIFNVVSLLVVGLMLGIDLIMVDYKTEEVNITPFIAWTIFMPGSFLLCFLWRENKNGYCKTCGGQCRVKRK